MTTDVTREYDASLDCGGAGPNGVAVFGRILRWKGSHFGKLLRRKGRY